MGVMGVQPAVEDGLNHGSSPPGRFGGNLRMGKTLTMPRAETPTHYIAFGMDEDLENAMQQDCQEQLLVQAREMTRGVYPEPAEGLQMTGESEFSKKILSNARLTRTTKFAKSESVQGAAYDVIEIISKADKRCGMESACCMTVRFFVFDAVRQPTMPFKH